jgi:acyl-CoA thioester hydrolase
MISEARLRVRYAETDQMGVVYHSNHLVWFEVGRVEFFRQMGFTYKQLENEEGCHIAVVEARCRYRAPARYDDCILVRTRLKSVRSGFLQYGYEILREPEGTLLAEGETTHVVIDRQMNRRNLPEKYLAAFQAAAGQETDSGACGAPASSERKNP